MRKDFLNKLCCPMDKADLKTQVFLQDEEGHIIEALMTCPKCKRYYPVIYGIPIMTPDEFREKALEEPLLKKWGKLETLNLNDNQEKILELET
jgi:uncharacterized protein YbaR (Trm112 family)